MPAPILCPYCSQDITHAKGHYWDCSKADKDMLRVALKPSPLFTRQDA